MYEELIERLREYPDREETVGGYVEIDWQDLLDAADVIESLTARLAALQAENAEKDKEIVKLKLEKELMRQEWDTSQAALSRVDAEKNDLQAQWDMYGGAEGIQGMLEKLQRLEAERDAVKRDIESILRSCTCEVRHEFCVRHDEPGGCDSDDCHDAKWRGPQGEG